MINLGVAKWDTVIYSRNYIVKMFYLLKSTFNNRRIKHFMNTLVLGSEPQDDGLDSRDHWKRVMQGHVGANLVSQMSILNSLMLYSGLK